MFVNGPDFFDSYLCRGVNRRWPIIGLGCLNVSMAPMRVQQVMCNGAETSAKLLQPESRSGSVTHQFMFALPAKARQPYNETECLRPNGGEQTNCVELCIV